MVAAGTSQSGMVKGHGYMLKEREGDSLLLLVVLLKYY